MVYLYVDYCFCCHRLGRRCVVVECCLVVQRTETARGLLRCGERLLARVERAAQLADGRRGLDRRLVVVVWWWRLSTWRRRRRRSSVDFGDGREHAVHGPAREVALVGHAAVVLAQRLVQLDAGPLALGELGRAQVAQHAHLEHAHAAVDLHSVAHLQSAANSSTHTHNRN